MASFVPPPPETLPPAENVSVSASENNATKDQTPKSYQATRQSELDAIRRRGLTKIFNRHFTSTSEKIRVERDAAEAALAEIEKRKAELAANPKSYNKDGDGLYTYTLTQLDAMHFELQRRKHTVHRKERETQELYKRYVTKFGGSGSEIPDLRRNSISSNSSPAVGVGSGAANALPILHEHNDEVVRQADLLIARALEKNHSEKNAKVNQKSTKIEHSTKYDKTSPVPPVNMFSNSGAAKMMEAPKSPNKIAPTSLVFDSPSPGLVSTPLREDEDDKQPDVLSPSGSFGNDIDNSSFLKGGFRNISGEHDEDSTMSGLTSIDGATVAEAEFRLTEFLKVETENIRKMFGDGEGSLKKSKTSHNGDDAISTSSPSTLVTNDSKKTAEAAAAAKKAEELAKTMKEATAWMEDPTLLESDSENEEEDISEEKKESTSDRVLATDKRENKSVTRSSNSVVSAGSSKINTTSSDEEIQWFAYWADEHKKEYYFNINTNQTCWTRPDGVKIDMSAAEEAKPDDDEESYKDDNVVLVKDFSKTSSFKKKLSYDSMDANLAMIKEFQPNSTRSYDRDLDEGSSVASGSVSSSSNTRVKAYKRKRALKMRKRRRAALAVSMIVVVSLGFYFAREAWMPLLGIQTARQRAEMDAMNMSKEQALEQKRREVERLKIETERLKMEAEARRKEEKEQKKKELEEKKKAEEERKRKEFEEAKKKAEEDKKKVEEEKKRKEDAKRRKLEEEELKRQQEAEKERLRKELEQQIREEERRRLEEEYAKQLQVKEEDEEDETDSRFAVVTEESVVRPVWCLFPGVWVVSKRCRLLASKKPVYDLKGLTDVMMQ